MGRRLRFLRTGRFWLNFVFILAATCWLPMLTQTATMTGPDGAVMKQTTLSVRAYQSWQMLFTKGPGAGHGQAVALHFGLCFLITAAVWFVMFRPVIQDLPDPAPEASGDDASPSPGDAPHE